MRKGKEGDNEKETGQWLRKST